MSDDEAATPRSVSDRIIERPPEWANQQKPPVHPTQG